MPESIAAFLGSHSYEDAVRTAVSLGGDSDTMACIAGGIAHAFHREVPHDLKREVQRRLPEEQLDVVHEFESRFPLAPSP